MWWVGIVWEWDAMGGILVVLFSGIWKFSFDEGIKHLKSVLEPYELLKVLQNRIN